MPPPPTTVPGLAVVEGEAVRRQEPQPAVGGRAQHVGLGDVGDRAAGTVGRVVGSGDSGGTAGVGSGVGDGCCSPRSSPAGGARAGPGRRRCRCAAGRRPPAASSRWPLAETTLPSASTVTTNGSGDGMPSSARMPVTVLPIGRHVTARWRVDADRLPDGGGHRLRRAGLAARRRLGAGGEYVHDDGGSPASMVGAPPKAALKFGRPTRCRAPQGASRHAGAGVSRPRHRGWYVVRRVPGAAAGHHPGRPPPLQAASTTTSPARRHDPHAALDAHRRPPVPATRTGPRRTRQGRTAPGRRWPRPGRPASPGGPCRSRWRTRCRPWPTRRAW